MSKRSANFTFGEEALLVQLAKKFKHVLENKRSDTNANREKFECWGQIENEFNSQNGQVYRTGIVLRKKYENIKKQTKKKVAEEKCYRFKTGGGPNSDIKYTEIDENIMEVLGETRVQGLPASFGSDADIETIKLVVEDENAWHKEELSNVNLSDCSFLDENASTEEPMPNLNCEILSQLENEISSESQSEIIMPKLNWKKHCGEMLKTQKSIVLTPQTTSNNQGINGSNLGTKYERQQRQVTDKVSQWAKKKSEVETRKHEIFDEEHNLKMRLMQEKHVAELKILEKESELRLLKMEKEMDQTVKGLIEEQKLKKEVFQLQKYEIIKRLRRNSD